MSLFIKDKIKKRICRYIIENYPSGKKIVEIEVGRYFEVVKNSALEGFEVIVTDILRFAFKKSRKILKY